MTKNKALKIAIEALDTLMIEKGSIYQQALNACKEALEPEPMTTTDVITCKMAGKCCMTGEALEQPAQLSGNSEQLKQDHSADAGKIGELVAWKQELNTKNCFSGLKDKNT
jgi:hypothetical protein